MAITLRLARHGNRNSPHYRIVAGDKGEKRDGRFVEIVGTYNTLTNPPKVTLKEESIKKWVGRGANITQVVKRIITKQYPGLIEEREKHQRSKIQERRKKRKAKAKAKGSTKASKKTKTEKKAKAKK